MPNGELVVWFSVEKAFKTVGRRHPKVCVVLRERTIKLDVRRAKRTITWVK